ncbi:GSCFA domain-containing protein [Weeksella virosa]|uniref:GSCFA domain protein n=1 Tax=Weeksella virosa (strain ATCC 43766 / DSM 16922 / JCM 21250 / CCUG 30538 / CDC 9751 / IAM 14551 / NBRC 16016 / NCTC 11634 / CL345/78) TaxID=865938 RepID=F0P1S2_WEEVC|nr:GSCFA domain-containing protein [Weeksella virosa]ADX68719.1 GSCFA domain protein [Weeksella virosa DSM 16922]MDK7675859.1 GSCFA domain-containing protein [Weeksella virosa]VEH63610.1 GSCFA family [Weeksella virosa]
MQFRTEITPKKPPFFIHHKHKIVSIGSCFAQEIGARMSNAKFNIQTNPFGILFHPLAIENALGRIHSRIHYITNEIFEYNNLFFSWDHHSSFSNPSKVECINQINQSIEFYNDFCRNADYFIVTLGTAWVYKIKSMDLIVANCHKLPQREFEKKILSTQEIYQSLQTIMQLILDMAPIAKIIFTVSPVRHIKDGLMENHVSKGRLINAVYEIEKQYNELFYFPAYELMMDDLRDYRFYKNDYLHPNELAIDYIWDKFTQTWMQPHTHDLLNDIKKVNQALGHRAFNEQSIQHQSFLYNTIKEMKRLNEKLTENNYKKEIELLEQKLRKC